VSELSGFCVFHEDDSTKLREFFSGFRRKYLIITTFFAKQNAHLSPSLKGSVLVSVAGNSENIR